MDKSTFRVITAESRFNDAVVAGMRKEGCIFKNSIIVMLGLSCCCTLDVMRVDDYRSKKKEIRSVACIVKSDIRKVNDHNSMSPDSWQFEPSPEADSFATDRIGQTVKNYSRRNFQINPALPAMDQSTIGLLHTLFAGLAAVDDPGVCTIDGLLCENLKVTGSRFVIVFEINGYHFSRKHLDKLEVMEVGRLLTGGISLGYAIGSSIGTSIARAIADGNVGADKINPQSKGYAELTTAFIDVDQRKVLYYSERASTNDPLADSTIINQVHSALTRF